MSYARELGFAIRKASEDQETKQALCAALGISGQELEKLYAGRRFLTSDEVYKTAEACGVTPEALLDGDRDEYDRQVVHCMSDFKHRENREMILDLIDAYVDVREALAE